MRKFLLLLYCVIAHFVSLGCFIFFSDMWNAIDNIDIFFSYKNLYMVNSKPLSWQKSPNYFQHVYVKHERTFNVCSFFLYFPHLVWHKIISLNNGISKKIYTKNLMHAYISRILVVLPETKLTNSSLCVFNILVTLIPLIGGSFYHLLVQ